MSYTRNNTGKRLQKTLMDKRKCGNENATERFCLERADVPQQLIGACLPQSRRTALHRYDNGMERIREWQDYRCRLSVARPPRATPLVKIKGHRPPPGPPLCLTARVRHLTGFLVSPGAAERSSFWKGNVAAVAPGQRTLLSSRNENLCTSTAAAFLSLFCKLAAPPPRSPLLFSSQDPSYC